MVVFETVRLRVRHLTLADVNDLWQVLGDPIAMQYYPAAFTREQTEGWIRHAQRSYTEHNVGLWALVHKADGAFIGDCGLTWQPVEGARVLEIGYHLIRRYWSQGFATEAAQACRDYAFAILDAPRVVSIIGPENEPSRRVGERVHSYMREFTWEKNSQHMCLYWTDRSDWANTRHFELAESNYEM